MVFKYHNSVYLLKVSTTGHFTLENVPPTKAALHKHIDRPAYQTIHVWRQSLKVHQENIHQKYSMLGKGWNGLMEPALDMDLPVATKNLSVARVN
jgi:hypothetical protein